MKSFFTTLTLLSILALMPGLAAPASAQEVAGGDREANLVILDETGVRNLGIETVEVLETDFEDTFFALGRIDSIPTHRGVVSSRIAGRVVDLLVAEGDTVEKGDVVARVESRVAGDPPPTIDMKAPLAGLITDNHVRLGEPVEPDKDLLDIIDLSKVYAVARIPEDRAGRLELGTEAHISVPAAPGEELTGKLIRFGTAADIESGTIDAFFEVPNPTGRIRPDMRAEFSVVLSKRDFVMAVPREALQGDPTNRFVFVKDFDLPNAYVKAPVVVGERNDRYFEIVSGLFPGDEVVTTGSYPLAFAGSGGVSLKEALDAAHGHEHNPDGSELTAGQDAAHDDHDHGHGHEGEGAWNTLTIFFAAVSALLLALLIVSSVMHRRRQHHVHVQGEEATHA